MEKLIHKLTYTIAAICVVVLFIISSLVGGGVGSAYAATSTTVTAFDKTNVLDDLETATIDGKKFSVVNYPYDSTGAIKHPEIFSVVEYCYSMRPALRDNFALYVYFYNPQALNISTTSRANKITLGVKYGEDKDGNVKVEDYEKFDLQFCSKSSGDYTDLFYKFKVIDHVSADGKTIAQRVNSVERRYDISEIELLTVGDTNATAYGVGGTYKFKGYAAGYGADIDGESTLEMTAVDDLETVTLDLAGVKDGVDKRTYWRSNSSSLGAYHQNQINSVFFAIDTNVLEKFGYTLQKIKAEWWEYKTHPVLIVENGDNVVKGISPYLGQYIGETFDKNRGYNIYQPHMYTYRGSYYVDYYNCWNIEQSEGDATTILQYISFLDMISLIFSSGNISVNDYVLPSDVLEEYCRTYDKSFTNGHFQINEHDFSADLFADEVDEGRTRGYNLREFDITNPDDLWQINSYDSTHNWWDKFIDYGFGRITTSDDYKDVLPIQELKAEDFTVSNVADHLKINKNDVSKLKDYFNASVKDNNGDGKPDNAVYLFRYAQTDYWCADDYKVGNFEEKKVHNATLSTSTVFFDFDILTMTFNKAGNLTTLGVVSSPIDHWSSHTPPINAVFPDWWSWLKKIFAGFLVILLVVLVAVLSPPVGAFLIQVIVLPFKALGWLFRKIGKLFKKKE